MMPAEEAAVDLVDPSTWPITHVLCDAHEERKKREKRNNPKTLKGGEAREATAKGIPRR